MAHHQLADALPVAQSPRPDHVREALARVALRPLPLRVGEAEAMVAEVPAAATLLAGFRGQPPADVDSLHRCLEALGDYAWADRAAIAELDLNPIKVLPRGRGCVVVDALIVPRGRRAEEPPWPRRS